MIRLVSHVTRAIRDLHLTNTQFAAEAQVARSTLQKLISNEFKQIRVDTIERIARRLNTTDISTLLELQTDPASFLAPFSEKGSVTFIFGTHDVQDARGRQPEDRRMVPLRTTVDMWDVRAQTEFLSHVRSHVPEIRDQMEFFSKESFGAEEAARVLELVKSQNTVIVGSPKVNPACEAVLRALFPGAVSGSARSDRGPSLRLAEKGRMEHSILGTSGYDEVGVVDVRSGRMIARTHFAGPGSAATDVGIILAVFRPLETKERVTLVIAAGITGCGTCGAIRGLAAHEPQPGEIGSEQPWTRAFCTNFVKPTDSSRDDRCIQSVDLVQEEGDA